ncbi:hypothetical protein GCM10025870_11650 [Agromyces marinus]|uniref:Enoyl-CoA hydratase/isomerase family protein n=1 Tax=Agromyces marinus TaxID=1389020 RepID=A0ABN6YD57_9MICO|nr:enoyl-CoA hydratase/isomerase family protein [Agromyces marinus]BDZ54092.1 hypothetical protein GCM10025870_11650 [Agromyces marinus]
MQPASPNIRLEVDGHVAIITIDRPEKLNSVTPEMSYALVDAIEWADAAAEVRAIVLTGAGSARSARAPTSARSTRTRRRGSSATAPTTATRSAPPANP